MNKKGEIQRPMFEIAYISFAILIGLAVLSFVYSNTKDTSIQAQIYSQDIANTLEVMQVVNGNNVKVNYILPKSFKFRLDNNFVYIAADKTEEKAKFSENKNFEIKFERNGDLLVLEKYDKQERYV